jgi:hypothetical protein
MRSSSVYKRKKLNGLRDADARRDEDLNKILFVRVAVQTQMRPD